MEDKFYCQVTSDVIKNLESNEIEGLSNKEVNERLLKYGKNDLPKKKQKSVLEIFFSGFLDPIVLLLLATIIVSIFIGEYIDATVIFFIVILDLILGTVSEYHANKNALGLTELIKYQVRVIRNKEEKLIDSINLVPGDIVLLESGDKIAADMRIINEMNLQVNESILTGESTSVLKNSHKISENTPLADRSNMLYAGCSIMTGRCVAIVVKTGIHTEIGYIANTVSQMKEEKSPLMIRINKLSKQISLLILIVAFIIFIILLLKGFELSDIFMSVVALSVSAMPEGLPLALTMALTITSNKMIKNNVIVKKLYYVEALGSCSVIATDKTGTLTVNEQTAKVIMLPNNQKYEISGVGYKNQGEILKLDLENRLQVEQLVLEGKLNNEAKKTKKNTYYGDSIDIAFLVLAEKANIYSDEYEVIKSIPYESENRYSAIFYRYQGEYYCAVKGSLEIVTSFCNKMDVNSKKVPIQKKLLSEQNDELSKDGYRVIALATGKVKKFVLKDYYDINDIPDLSFLGMVGFIDPVRNDVYDAISKCHQAGVDVLMITGDHPMTAYSIAKELGITASLDEVVTGSDLEKLVNDSDFDHFIQDKKVFARITPNDKYRIVESLKRRDEFVAVTGDGVNDALAIRSANIGVSMGSGTDTAKETASMIIVDDSFKSIVSGIELGRMAYSNIRKVCYFLLSCGLAEVLFFLLSIIFNLPMPLVAIQLLWLNLVTDGFQDIALSYETNKDGLMDEKPINSKESIFNKALREEIMISGLTIGLIVFALWYFLINVVRMDVSEARGYIMALMVFIQNIHVFNCRSETKSAFTVSLRNNPIIGFTIFGSILLQIIVMEVPVLSEYLKVKPISYSHMLALLIFSFIILIVMEGYKLIKKRK